MPRHMPHEIVASLLTNPTLRRNRGRRMAPSDTSLKQPSCQSQAARPLCGLGQVARAVLCCTARAGRGPPGRAFTRPARRRPAGRGSGTPPPQRPRPTRCTTAPPAGRRGTPSPAPGRTPPSSAARARRCSGPRQRSRFRRRPPGSPP